MEDLRDITPSPRILRTLGEIPFAPWQCIAELVDNALDSFRSGITDGSIAPDAEKRVIISWSSDNVISTERQLEITDTGPGLELDVIQNSARAGYTTNDPVNNLGLFGMGFNIATARLGEKTTFLSATLDSPDWVGIEIDFANLVARGEFRAPVVHVPKMSQGEHGTRVIVSRLKPNIFNELKKSSSQIRDILADIYSPILRQFDIEIMVQSRVISPRRHCIWDHERYVSVQKGKESVPAVLEIDEVVGEALFDTGQNRYLTPDEEDEIRHVAEQTGNYPDYIITREKRIQGWLAVQRYPDPSDFGLDFIRNGRKILRRDKTLFSFANPITGAPELDYPTELGSTVGGRIVGEINVDHVPPNYQKNDFDRTDPSWYEVVEVLRGAGPILPKKRKAMGYNADNVAPLARLIRAYQVIDQGTQHLAAPHAKAREYAKYFRDGNPDYETDEKWWEAAVEFDRQKADKDAPVAPAVDPGSQSSDDPSRYMPESPTPETIVIDGIPPAPQNQAPPQTSPGTATPTIEPLPTPPSVVDVLKSHSRQIQIESGEYGYPGCKAPFQVTVWEVEDGKIGDNEDDDPCILFKDGNRCDFFFNPRHSFLRDYPITYRDLVLVSLAERFKVRDNLGSDIAVVFASMVIENLSDTRLDQSSIQEAANIFFDRLREHVPGLLSLREREAIDCVHESIGEVEEIAASLIYNGDLLNKFQTRAIGAISSLSVAPARTLVRLVDTFPEEFFDGKFFNTPFMAINLPDPSSTERLRNGARERLLSFLKDALWVISEPQSSRYRLHKKELARCAYSLGFLSQEVEP